MMKINLTQVLGQMITKNGNEIPATTKGEWNEPDVWDGLVVGNALFNFVDDFDWGWMILDGTQHGNPVYIIQDDKGTRTQFVFNAASTLNIADTSCMTVTMRDAAKTGFLGGFDKDKGEVTYRGRMYRLARESALLFAVVASDVYWQSLAELVNNGTLTTDTTLFVQTWETVVDDYESPDEPPQQHVIEVYRHANGDRVNKVYGYWVARPDALSLDLMAN